MKKVTRRTMMGLIVCGTVLALLPGATGKDKPKHQSKAPIMAIAPDGTTWIAGEAKFSVVGSTLEVSIDLASGVPSAKVWLYPATDPWVITTQPEFHLILTDGRGDLNYTESYGINTLEPFDVWLGISVEGAAVHFSTDKSNPVTVDPKG